MITEKNNPNEILKVELCNLFTLNMIIDEKKATKKRYNGKDKIFKNCRFISVRE